LVKSNVNQMYILDFLLFIFQHMYPSTMLAIRLLSLINYSCSI